MYVNSERFFRLQEKWMYTSRYTQSQAVDRARVSLYLWVIFVISLLFPRFETQRKQRFKQVFVIILQKKTKRHFSNHQNTNSITHTKINTIDYHHYNKGHYMKAKQRLSSHLNINSHLILGNIETQKHKFNYAI